MAKVGDRVGAILSQNEHGIQFLGFGTYEGEAVPENAIGWMAEALREYKQSNPKIRLDNGKVVWGCECWWGSAEKIQKSLDSAIAQGVAIIDTDIDQVRIDFGAQGE